MMKKAQRMANVANAMISKSCNKVMIGKKTFGKNGYQEYFMESYKKEYFYTAMNLTDTEISKLQINGNGVYRKIMGLKYVSNCTLRGEIGSSLMKPRMLKGHLHNIQGALKGENDLVEVVYAEIYKKSRWGKITKNTCIYWD